jgi:hypothetical protein
LHNIAQLCTTLHNSLTRLCWVLTQCGGHIQLSAHLPSLSLPRPNGHHVNAISQPFQVILLQLQPAQPSLSRLVNGAWRAPHTAAAAADADAVLNQYSRVNDTSNDTLNDTSNDTLNDTLIHILEPSSEANAISAATHKQYRQQHISNITVTQQYML